MLPKRPSLDPLSLIFAVSLAALISRPACAAATFSGSVSPADPTVAGVDPIIGVSDIGRLTITAGSVVTSDVAIVGDLINGIGLVSVTGLNSTWTTTSLMVGDAGTGRLEILSGAIVNVDFATNPGVGDLVIGNIADSVGTVIVNGLGSMLRMGDNSTVGINGTGILRIENEGYVVGTNDLGTDTFAVGLHGRIELAGGRLRSEQLTNNGVIIGDGRLDNEGTIVNSSTGHIEAGAADRLVVNAVLTNQGEIAVVGGEIEFFEAVTSSVTGAEVTLRDGGRVKFLTTGFGYDSTSGTLASTAGVNDIYGTVRIQGATSKIVVAGESTAVFHDAVTNSGGTIEVFPGSTPVYLQGLTTIGSGSVLSIHLADPAGDPDFGQVEVQGTAELAGNLQVQLATGFVPMAGDAFQILTAGVVSGALGLSAAPPLPGGMQWDLDINASNVVLSVVATGDYNANGVVDAADYVVWRNTLGLTGAGLAADGNGNGTVDAADYDFWRARFGNVVAGSAAAATSAVPEAGGATLLLIGAISALSRKRLTDRGGRRPNWRLGRAVL